MLRVATLGLVGLLLAACSGGGSGGTPADAAGGDTPGRGDIAAPDAAPGDAGRGETVAPDQGRGPDAPKPDAPPSDTPRSDAGGDTAGGDGPDPDGMAPDALGDVARPDASGDTARPDAGPPDASGDTARPDAGDPDVPPFDFGLGDGTVPDAAPDTPPPQDATPDPGRPDAVPDTATPSDADQADAAAADAAADGDLAADAHADAVPRDTDLAAPDAALADGADAGADVGLPDADVGLPDADAVPDADTVPDALPDPGAADLGAPDADLRADADADADAAGAADDIAPDDAGGPDIGPLGCTPLASEPWARRAPDPGGVVVFNEIQYNVTGDAELEWVEIQNQLAVDTDLSDWALADGISYRFPPGTLIPAGGYLVIAANPVHLAEVTGFAGALGPYQGRLSNGGEEIQLRNNTGRVMDAVRYDDAAPWPIAPDGSGVSLARTAPETAGAHAENWRPSAAVGGTPGGRNFPDPNEPPTLTEVVPLDATWRYDASGVEVDPAWHEPGFDDSGWQFGPATFFAGVGATTMTLTARLTADNYFAYYLGRRDASNLRLIGRDRVGDWTSVESLTTDLGPDDHVYVAAWEARGDSGSPQMLIGEFSLPDGTTLGTAPTPFEALLGPTNANPGGSFSDPPPAVAALQTLIQQANLLAAWAPPAVSADRTSGPWGYAVSGSFGDATKYIWLDTFDNNSLTNQRETYALFRSTEPLMPGGGTTELPLGVTTYAFRTDFTFDGDPARTELLLDVLVDDGAIFYLNGVEIYRQNMPAGPVAFDAFASTTVDEAALVSVGVLPSTALLSGPNVLSVELHQAAADDPDLRFAARLVTREWPLVPAAAGDTLAFSEVAAAETSPFWLELTNRGAEPFALAGVVVVSSAGAEYVIPREALAPGEFFVLDAATLGFSPAEGDKLFLYAADRGTVLDAVEVGPTVRARAADDTPGWFQPYRPTLGAANDVELTSDVVINEILYHHRPRAEEGAPFEESPEEWLELYNRGAAAVDLSGYRLADGIQFVFPAGTLLPPGGYLVVARDAAALAAKYPDIPIVGDYEGGLSNSGDRIELSDACGNLVDAVRYADGGRFPEYADGGGPSLELRDPRADNLSPEAWAASAEGPRASWQSFSYRGTAQASRVGPDGQWHEFVLGLLDAGEVWLDDIRVVEAPAGAALNVIQNSTFDDGTAATWRLLGNHRQSEVIADPDNPGNFVLRLVATGPTGHMHNHAETTLANGRAITNGVPYEISFRAKWVAGSNQLNTRLYFNRLARTTLLPQPALHGTPGAPNTAYVANAGPTYADFGHTPVVPAPGEPVRVSVAADDPDGIATATLYASVNGGAFTATPMSDDGNGRFVADLPGQPAATLVQFYVEAEDLLGAASTFPAAGPASRALYKVDDGLAATNGLHNLRILLTPADSDWFHAPVNLMSDDAIGTTVIYDEREAYYDVGVRAKGSERGRPVAVRLGFGLYFHADRPFRGVHKSVLIDRSQGVNYGQREMLMNQVMARAGSVACEYNDLIQVMTPRREHTGPAELQLDRFSGNMLDAQFENGSDGNLYEYELIYYPLTTDTGSPQGLKLPQPDSVVGTAIRDLGDDKENYRHNFLVKNNRRRDDPTAFVAFAKVFGLTGAAFRDQVAQYADVDQWLRSFAFGTLSGAVDHYASGAQHNVQFYVRPVDGRVLYFPHDLDFFPSDPRTPLVQNSDLSKLLAMPGNTRRYYGHLYDIIQTSYNGAYLAHWRDHYTALCTGQNFAPYHQFMVDRAAWVLTSASNSIENTFPQLPFRVTTNGGGDFSVVATEVTIAGEAWIDVREIWLTRDMAALDVTWVDERSWQVTLPLALGPNPLEFLAYDAHGNEVGRASLTVTATP